MKLYVCLTLHSTVTFLSRNVGGASVQTACDVHSHAHTFPGMSYNTSTYCWYHVDASFAETVNFFCLSVVQVRKHSHVTRVVTVWGHSETSFHSAMPIRRQEPLSKGTYKVQMKYTVSRHAELLVWLPWRWYKVMQLDRYLNEVCVCAHVCVRLHDVTLIPLHPSEVKDPIHLCKLWYNNELNHSQIRGPSINVQRTGRVTFSNHHTLSLKSFKSCSGQMSAAD